jgi:hypothetical protein
MIGTYQNEETQNECKGCPRGTFNTDNGAGARWNKREMNDNERRRRRDAVNVLHDYLMKKFHLLVRMMAVGNMARVLHDPKNREILLGVIPSPLRRDVIRQYFEFFDPIRVLIKSIRFPCPMMSFLLLMLTYTHQYIYLVVFHYGPNECNFRGNRILLDSRVSRARLFQAHVGHKIINLYLPLIGRIPM